VSDDRDNVSFLKSTAGPMANPHPGDPTNGALEFLKSLGAVLHGRPVHNVVTLVLDRTGHFTLHSSTNDVERTLAMLTMGQSAALGMWAEAATTLADAGSESKGEENAEDAEDADDGTDTPPTGVDIN
jgi:hypothetical protein